LEGENALCQEDADCPEYLACNTSGVCLKRYGKLCAESSQCVNNLECIEYVCQCPSTQFATGSTCNDRKEFQETCQNDNQCVDSLKCDINKRICLKKYRLACSNNTECVNNINCLDDLCGCGSQDFDQYLDVCIESNALGDFCNYNSNCTNTVTGIGIFCPTPNNYCHFDFGYTCSNDNQCANNMFCNYLGVCSCQTGLGEPNSNTGSLSYNDTIGSHSCYLNTNYDNLPCNKTSECQSNLVCDSTTQTCKRSYYQACITTLDCEASYVCTHQKCLCPAGSSVVMAMTPTGPEALCIQYRHLGEPCSYSSQCHETLVCNTVTGPDQAAGTCLKTYGDVCSSSSSCANNLQCIQGKCACSSTSYWAPQVNDCKSIGGGKFINCGNDNQCPPMFGCDLQASGFRSKECLSDRNQNCGSDSDCVNNLVCRESVCRCSRRLYYDKISKSCTVSDNL